MFIIIVCLSCMHYYNFWENRFPNFFTDVVMMVLRDSNVNEVRGRDVFMCARSDDAKTVSFTWHLGSVLVLPCVGAVFPVKVVICQ